MSYEIMHAKDLAQKLAQDEHTANHTFYIAIMLSAREAIVEIPWAEDYVWVLPLLLLTTTLDSNDLHLYPVNLE